MKEEICDFQSSACFARRLKWQKRLKSCLKQAEIIYKKAKKPNKDRNQKNQKKGKNGKKNSKRLPKVNETAKVKG